MQTEFTKLDVKISGYDPASTSDRNAVFKLLQASPRLPYVELTDGNVTFVNDPFSDDPDQRVRIQPRDEDEFNTEDVMMILTLSQAFFYDTGRFHGRINNRLHAGIVLANDGTDAGDSVYVMGETFAGLRGALKVPR